MLYSFEGQRPEAGKCAYVSPLARVIRKLKEKDKRLWNYGKQLFIELAARYLKQELKPLG